MKTSPCIRVSVAKWTAVLVLASAPARASSPTPKPTPAAPSSVLGASTPTAPADAPLPSAAAARVAANTPASTPAPEVLSTGDAGSFPWGWCGITLGLLAANAFAWSLLWTWLPDHGGWRQLFSRSGGRRRRDPWEERERGASGGQGEGTQAFRELLDEMRATLDSRRAIGMGSLPAGAGSAADFQRDVLRELAEIRHTLGLPRTSTSTPAEARPIALPVGRSAAEPYPVQNPAVTAEDLTDQYNRATRFSRGRDEFMALPGVFRLGVKNSTERLHDVHAEPVFSRHEQGEYVAVPWTQHPGHALVFPRFQAPLNHNNYRGGAVDRVFRCPDYRDGSVYQEVTVVAPAVFEQAEAGEWRLAGQGELALGSPA